MKRFYVTVLALLTCVIAVAQVPALNSMPSSPYVIYLDFDGETVNNPNWYASTINAEAPILTNAQITEVFNRVAEKYIPFNVNVTTSLAVFNAAAVTKRIQVVLTPTSSWYGSAGGVAFVGSFGYASYSPAWIFTNNLANSPDYIASAAAHEIGHTLWLSHHGQYNSSCQRTASYHSGKGTGQTSWGPIMGAPYYSNFIVWYKGSTTSLACADTDQDDLALITTNNGFTYKNDDHGNTMMTATNLNLISNSFADSGIIERNNDVDFFKFALPQVSNITINVRPWSLNPAANTGACLDTKIELYNTSGVLIASDSSITTLNSSISQMNLPAGTYYIKIDGTGIANYNDFGGTGSNDYGSLGRFYINATITPTGGGITPPVANFTPSTSTICAGQSVLCNDISTNSPTTWSWSCTGATPSTSTQQNPTFTFLTQGIYTISLTATNTGGSNTFSKQITVNANPTISANNQVLCSGNSVTISASGANTYVWSPATSLNSSTGANVQCSASSNITYTVTGTNSAGCMATKTVNITVNTSPNLTSNNPTICIGQNASLITSGANSYSWSPATALNATTGATVTSTTTMTTTYTIIGIALNGCTASKISVVTVNPLPTLVVSNATSICNGTSTNLSVSGASTYSWSPSNSLSNSTSAMVIATPTSSTTYTIIGVSSTGCSGQSTVHVAVNSPPILSGSGGTSLCNGTSTNLSVSGASTYAWSPSNSLNNSTSATVIATPSASVTYTITGIASNGCSATKNIIVTVKATPIIMTTNLSPQCSSASDGAITVNVSGGSAPYTYSWNTGATTQSLSSLSEGTYSVTVSSSNGCSAASSIILTPNTCSKPIALTPTKITSSSVVLRWSKVPCSYGYCIRRRVANTLNWTSFKISSNDSTRKFFNLIPGAVYEYQILSYCNQEKSDSSGYSSTYTFTTNSLCYAPETLAVIQVSGSSAIIQWNQMSTASSYRLRYTKTGGPVEWVELIIPEGTQNSFVIDGLLANTKYKYQVRNICDMSQNEVSNWSVSKFFTTTAGATRIEESIDNKEEVGLDLYPNPATRFVAIEADLPPLTEINVHIYDVTGRLMDTFIRDIQGGHYYEELDLTTYMKGMYVVSITYADKTITKKFVRR